MQKTNEAKKINVLFLCTGNSCRSQMAEGWARHLYDKFLCSFSAGVQPKTIDPLAIEVMKEVGIDISGQKAKHVKELEHIQFYLVITLCDHAAETCPIFSKQTTIFHKGFEDPPKMARKAKTTEETLAVYRKVRDEIGGFIKQWEIPLKENFPDFEIIKNAITTI